MISRTLSKALAAAVLVAGAVVSQTGSSPIGIFESRGDLGVTPKTGAIAYDAATGEYRVTGGGANIWGTEDALYFAWRRISGM